MQINETSRIVFLVAVALLMGSVAKAYDLPGAGTFSGESSCFGVYKIQPIDTERFFVIYDENCFSLGEGILNNLTWHCWGTTDFSGGFGSGQGYCIGTDPDGDRLAVRNGPDEKHEPRQLSWQSPAVLDGGTGKFAGIAGDAGYVNHANQFRSSNDGTFFNHVTIRGHYKLP